MDRASASTALCAYENFEKSRGSSNKACATKGLQVSVEICQDYHTVGKEDRVSFMDYANQAVCAESKLLLGDCSTTK